MRPDPCDIIRDKLAEIITDEIELTRPPCEGLASTYKTEAQRNNGLKFWLVKGMECQTWKCKWNGIEYFGFSYNHKYRLSKRQLAEFKRLKK